MRMRTDFWNLIQKAFNNCRIQQKLLSLARMRGYILPYEELALISVVYNEGVLTGVCLA